jgi:hypothetical protein
VKAHLRMLSEETVHFFGLVRGEVVEHGHQSSRNVMNSFWNREGFSILHVAACIIVSGPAMLD